MEHQVLLSVYLFDRRPSPMVAFGHLEPMFFFQLTELAIDLIEQEQKAAVEPSSLRLCLAPHLAIGYVAPFPFQIFGTGRSYAQGLADGLQLTMAPIHALP